MSSWAALLAGRLLGGGLLAIAMCRPGTTEPVAPASSVSSASQTLGPGDIIEIRVTDQEELTGEYQVAADGTIRFPWIEQVEVAGRSQGQIAEIIEQKLADGWLRQPQVTVRVITRQNREVSVLGQVNEPGSYPFKERLTLVQAISLAGGMNPLAQAKKVKLIRETDQGTKTYEIDVREILESRQADLPLEPGDIVFVPEAPI